MLQVKKKEKKLQDTQHITKVQRGALKVVQRHFFSLFYIYIHLK